MEITAEPSLLCAAVPQMVLQPIVENAIRHGLAKRAAAGRIEIRAARKDSRVELTVTDDGPGFASGSPAEGTGIGLGNTRARLKQLYGDAAELRVRNGEHGGAVVTMALPFRELECPSDHEVAEIHAVHHADR